MLPVFGKPLYDDYDAYRRVSAVNYVKNAKTPTFIYVGERDIEVPPTQSIEWWHALKDMGVPTTLMIYEGEGHDIRDPDHAQDMQDRTNAWFDKYLADRPSLQRKMESHAATGAGTTTDLDRTRTRLHSSY